MKNKILSVLLALVLVVSLSLIPAVPAAAEDEGTNYSPFGTVLYIWGADGGDLANAMKWWYIGGDGAQWDGYQVTIVNSQWPEFNGQWYMKNTGASERFTLWRDAALTDQVTTTNIGSIGSFEAPAAYAIDGWVVFNPAIDTVGDPRETLGNMSHMWYDRSDAGSGGGNLEVKFQSTVEHGFYDGWYLELADCGWTDLNGGWYLKWVAEAGGTYADYYELYADAGFTQPGIPDDPDKFVAYGGDYGYLFGPRGRFVFPYEAWVDDEGDDSNPGTEGLPFATIQKGINMVPEAGTVNVAPGTYYEHILIDEALTVRSTDGAEVTIIDSNAYRYKVTIEHSDVTFEGFTVTDPTYADGADATGILIHAYYDEDVSNVQIVDNIVTQIRSETGTSSTFGSCGINIGYAVTKGNTLSNIVISGNTITDIKNPEGGASDHTCGINVWDGADGVVIVNNTISDIKFNGIILEHAIDVRIEENSITGCESGIRVQPSVTVSGLTVNFNNITGNTYGVQNVGPEIVDAEYNWWGAANGPDKDGANPVSVDVDYSPWLPGTWQTYYNPVTEAEIDTDLDTFSDLQEYWLGTDPLDGTDFPGASVDEVANVYADDGGTAETETTNASITADAAAGQSASVNLAEYGDTPVEGESVFGAVGSYIDVHCDDPGNLDEVIIRVNYDPVITGAEELALRMSYWNSDVGDWRQCSDQGVDIDDNFIWAKIRDDTTPDLNYLAGGPFGGGAMSVELDSEWYRTGDTVEVTIEDATESGLIAAFVWSDTVHEAGKITLALFETGDGTGIFEGSFDLVDTPPGAGELLVNDGDLITVAYLGVGYTATVDDTLPVIAIDAVTTPTTVATQAISGTFTEENLEDIELTVGGVVVAIDVVAETWVTTAPAALIEGDNLIVVTITDLVGNSAFAGATINLDTAAPVVTIDIPDYINAANELAVPVTITSDEDGTYSYNISGETGGGPINAGVPVVLSLNLSVLAEGAVTADASVTDATLNVGVAPQDTATKDTGVPLAPSNMVVPFYINDANQATYTVTGMAEADSTVEVRITDGTTTVTNAGIAVGVTFSIEVNCSTLEDGPGNITIDAKATDAAHNESLYSDALVIGKDTLLPVVTIDIPEYINDANKLAVPVTITSDEDGDYSYDISGVIDTGPITVVPVVLSLDLSGLGDGPVTADASVTDAAGNVGVAPQDTATKDTGVPAAPVIELTDPINVANETDVAITGTGEPNAALAYTITDEGVGSVTGAGAVDGGGVISITGIDVSSLDDGILTASVTQTDAIGNTSPAGTDTATKDTGVPIVTIDISEYINAANEGAVPVTITSDEDGIYSYNISDGLNHVQGTGPITVGAPVVLTLDLSALDEGAVTAFAEVADAALNVGKAQDTATKDTECLAPVIELTDPINAANEGSVSITGTGEPNATLDYTITDEGVGSVTGAGAVDALGNIDITGIDVSTLDDGTLTASVTQTDAAGNTSAAGIDTATKDTEAPAVTIDIPDYINAANELAVPVTITSGEDGTYSYDISGLTGSGPITAGAPVVLSLDLSTLVDGPVTADASVTDAALNIGVAPQDTATKDTECLAPVIELTDPIYVVNKADVSITGTGEANATLSGTISDGVDSVPVTGAVDGGGNISIIGIDVSALADGTLTALVTQTDVAFNISPLGVDEATKDTVAPAVTIDISEYINAANELAVPVTITSNEDGTYVYNISGVIDTGLITAGAPVVLSLNLSALAEGPVTADTSVTDVAGNFGNAEDTATKDTAVPTITDLTPLDGAYVGTDTPTISALLSDANSGINPASIVMTVGGVPVACAYNAGTGVVSYTPAAPLAGAPEVTVNVSDLAGNAATEASWSFTVDTTLPVIAINDVGTPTNVDSQTISGTFTEVNLDTIVVTVGGNEVDVTIVVDTWMTTAPAALSEGDNLIVAIITDLGGNSAFAEATINLDTVAPVVTIDIPECINPDNAGAVPVTITSNEDGTYSYNVGGETDTGLIAAGVPVVLTLNLSGLGDGLVTANASVTDAAGNVGNAPQDTATKDTVAPAVTIDIPDYINAANAGAVPVTITSDEDGIYSYNISGETGGGPINAGVDVVLSLDLSALADGPVTADASVTDAVGNIGVAMPDPATKDTVAPVVMVTSPDGGESWLVGTTHNITWTATDDNFGAKPITIRYSINGGADWNGIGGAKLANTGTYSWTVPNLNSTAVLVKVIAGDRAGNNAADNSNSVFTITADIMAPSVTVNSPNGGESWLGGSTRTITWTATDDKTPSGSLLVDLYYSSNGGTDWISIASTEANNGAYSWLVPEINSSQCLVKVEATDSAGIASSDTSNNVFTISPVPAPPEEVTSIDLKVGWNFISLMLYIPPENRDPAILLAAVKDNVDIVWGNYDPATGGWNTYDPSQGVNDLTAMRDGKGYWVNMTADDVLDVSTLGTELPGPPTAPPTYDVVVGWNLIGFKSTTPSPASTYLAALGENYTTIYGFADGFYQTGDYLEPGKGYWLAVTEPGTIYP